MTLRVRESRIGGWIKFKLFIERVHWLSEVNDGL